MAVYLDQSVYLFNNSTKDYRNYLGLYFANFFDGRINEKNFAYDRDNNRFKSEGGIKLIVIADLLSNLSLQAINDLADPKTYVVIIPSGFFGDESRLDYLAESNALDVFVLTQEYVYMTKRKCKREITDTINRALISRAKEKASSLS